MEVLTGAFQILAVVIVAGGVAKVAAPGPFAELLSSLHLPGGRPLSRLSGLAEVALGVLAIIVGGRIAAVAVGVAYAVFAAVVVAARRSGAESCGCFGAVSAPPSKVHVVVNGVSALVALAAAVVVPASLADSVADQPLAGVPYVLAILTGAWLVVALDTTGAEVIDRVGAVHRMGPVFRENAVAATSPARATAPRTAAGAARTRRTTNGRT